MIEHGFSLIRIFPLKVRLVDNINDFNETEYYDNCMYYKKKLLQMVWKIPQWIIFEFYTTIYVMLCAIWYHLYNLKNVKNTHEGLLLLV